MLCRSYVVRAKAGFHSLNKLFEDVHPDMASDVNAHRKFEYSWMLWETLSLLWSIDCPKVREVKWLIEGRHDLSSLSESFQSVLLSVL